ncbi:hypothetical protein ACFU8I_41695 [Streptomyces sp. NPDC057540]|uniref:hypothetical protein n=1 Tax=Streptomyces sp. NPDC057540 TaxID=3346160 RepID=UPI0036D026AF
MPPPAGPVEAGAPEPCGAAAERPGVPPVAVPVVPVAVAVRAGLLAFGPVPDRGAR